MDRRSSQFLTIALIVAVLVLVWLVQTNNGPPGARPDLVETSIHLALGNPSGAADDLSAGDYHLMVKPYYALSYNNTKGTPNWVSWRLAESDLGTAPRSQFYPDPDLSAGFKHVVPHDYSETGFDRGHMCPHGDRTATAEAAQATFAMTNMIPQAPHVNQKAWADLEEYCRELVTRRKQTLYIVAGPAGRGGVGADGPADTIANGKVTVPAHCWKVVAVLDESDGGPDEAAKVGPHTRLIGVVVPNEQSVGHGWAKYRVSVREIEDLTGYRFFDRVPASVIDPLKAKVDTEHIPPGRPRHSGN